MTQESRSSDERTAERVRQALEPLNRIPVRPMDPEITTWLRRAARNTPQPHTHRPSLETLMRRTLAHPLRVATVLFGGLLFLACTSPVTTEVTLAQVIRGRIAVPPVEARALLSGLDWVEPGGVQALGEIRVPGLDHNGGIIGYVASGRAVVNGKEILTPTSTFVIALSDASAAAVARWTDELRSLPGVEEVRTEPVREEIQEPRYRSILRSFEFTPAVDAEVLRQRVAERIATLELHGIGVEIDESGAHPTLRLTVTGELDASTQAEVKSLLDSVGGPGGR